MCCHTDGGGVLLILLDRGAKDAYHPIVRRLSHATGFVRVQLPTVRLLYEAGRQRQFQVWFLKNQLVHSKLEIIFQGGLRDCSELGKLTESLAA